MLPMGATSTAIGRWDYEGSLAFPRLFALFWLVIFVYIDHVLLHSSIISIMELAGRQTLITNDY